MSAADPTPTDAAVGDLPRRAALTSVGWVHIGQGRLLAVRTRGRDAFYLPGGKVETGETHQQALVREVEEELGLGLDLGQVREVFTVRAPAHGLGQEVDLTMHCFTAATCGHPRPGREIEEVAWLDPDDPADRERAAPAVRLVLDRITAGTTQ